MDNSEFIEKLIKGLKDIHDDALQKNEERKRNDQLMQAAVDQKSKELKRPLTHQEALKIVRGFRKQQAQTQAPKPAAPVANPAPAAAPAMTFADMVNNHVNSAQPSFGHDKHFISHTYESLKQKHPNLGMDLNTFKTKLWEENRKGNVDLARADLSSAFDQNTLQQSSTEHPVTNARAHFIQSRKSIVKPAWDK